MRTLDNERMRREAEMLQVGLWILYPPHPAALVGETSSGTVWTMHGLMMTEAGRSLLRVGAKPVQPRQRRLI